MDFKTIRGAAAALLLPVAFAACDSTDDPFEVGGDATLSVYLTDAPGDVEAVWVEITEVTLRGGGEEVVLLDESTGLIEVTTLVSTAQEIVDDADIPAGTYGMLNLRLGGVVLETVDGDVYVMGGAEHPEGLEATGDLHCPGCSQSGLKVQLHGVEVDGGDNALVLDFDVSQSFGRLRGQSGRWVMHPVIHTAFAEDGEDDEDLDGDTRSIQGTVALADGVTLPECPAGTARSLEDFVPQATAATLIDDAGAAVVRSGEVDGDGEFEIDFVSPDDYALGFDPTVELEGFDLTFEATVDPASVTVGDDDVDGVVYTVTGASCAAVEG